VLHLTSGDVNVERLREARVAGDIVACIDALYDGPTLPGLPAATWRMMRARFAADAGWASFDEALGRLAEADEAIARIDEREEIVLWFEHDLHCQLMLVRLLDGLWRRDPAGPKLSLVCIGAFPGVERFRGLGQLAPAELAALFQTRRAVDDTMLDAGRRAWSAFCSTDPRAIEAVVADDTDALPFLRPALVRHLEEFPATGNGLSRTERQLLDAIAAGEGSRRALFGAIQAREETPFMGDTIVWGYLDALARGPVPLVSTRDDAVSLTSSGRRVLDGRDDAIALNGIDRWRGGVHLVAEPGRPETLWRWNASRARLELASYRLCRPCSVPLVRCERPPDLRRPRRQDRGGTLSARTR
jgi:hypothetical protein